MRKVFTKVAVLLALGCAAPIFAQTTKLNLGTQVKGVLPVANGGTGVSVAGTVVANLGTADPTGVADSSTQVNAAIALAVTNGITTGQCLLIPSGKFYAPTLSNPSGVQFCGYGILLKTISQLSYTGGPGTYPTATTAQSNTYATAAPRLVFGQEYLSHWLQLAAANMGSVYSGAFQAGVALRVVFAGDSRTAGTNLSTQFLFPQAFAQTAYNRGIPLNAVPINAGHSGSLSSDWLSTFLAADMVTPPDLYFINYGYNDAGWGQPTSQTCAAIRSGLATIRASHTVDQMSIVLMTPIGGNDYASGRAPNTLEKLRGCYAQAAHDYQAVFIDLYGLMPDNDFAVQTCMMDIDTSIPGTPVPSPHVHPGTCKAPIYMDLIAHALFDPLEQMSGNGVTDQPGSSVTVNAGLAPAAYPLGFSLFRNSSTGPYFPNDGMVFTIAQADGVWWQMNCSYSATPNVCSSRSAHNSLTWDSWTSMAAPGAWTVTTPTVTCATGSGTLAATVRVSQIGKTANVNINVDVTAVGTCASAIKVPLPFIVQASSMLSCQETALTGASGAAGVGAGGATMFINRYDNATLAATGNHITCNGTVETQ
jgi:hypothetical protein